MICGTDGGWSCCCLHNNYFILYLKYLFFKLFFQHSPGNSFFNRLLCPQMIRRLLIGIVQTIDFSGCLLIRIVQTIDFSDWLLIGIAQTINFSGCLFIGIVQTMDFGDHLLTGIVWAIGFECCLRIGINCLNRFRRLGIVQTIDPGCWSIHWNCANAMVWPWTAGNYRRNR